MYINFETNVDLFIADLLHYCYKCMYLIVMILLYCSYNGDGVQSYQEVSVY